MGLPISLFSALGIIALVGILVNDALVFVTTYNTYLKEGKDQMEAPLRNGLISFPAHPADNGNHFCGAGTPIV